ncbi:MAG: dTDP-4-dehydrorhamnose 3,5-epimerase [Bacteroidetes bacterium]|nr:MAG: dTDP-4-dehydrorhamnose 3,5-epimerase [Bacteroidota bacterium]
MQFIKTPIQDLVIIEPRVFGDRRGYFMESFKKDEFEKHVTAVEFVQDNESLSSRGVLRGLHFQVPPYTQSKLVRVIEGEVLDVAVDLRKNSKTYGQYYSILLSGENKRQLFVPQGFAHGFVVLSEQAIFSYKVDAPYAPEHESGIRWDDPELNIDWKLEASEVLLSEKDQELPGIKNFQSPF